MTTDERKIQFMVSRGIFCRLFVMGILVSSGLHLCAQDDTSRRHGRKYKAPPPTSHIEVYVTKKATGKPVVNAAVIFRALREGKDDGNLEVKTDPDGKATIDVISTGSLVRVQVIANGLATYADAFQVDEPSREIHVALLKPQEQVSAYEDNSGKDSTRKPGVQESRPIAKPNAPSPVSPKSTPQSSNPDAPAGTPQPAPQP